MEKSIEVVNFEVNKFESNRNMIEKDHHDSISSSLLKLSDEEFRKEELRSLYYHQNFIKEIGDIKGKRILECGCGDGLMACFMALQGANVWAFDISPGMIEVATRRAKLWGVLNKIHFDVKEFEKISYKENFFDKIYGDFILHHVDIERSMALCNAILATEGQAIFRETSSLNPLLMFSRKYIIGHFGIKRGSTPGEMPLNYQDIEKIRHYFRNVHVFFPEMHLCKMIQRSFSMPGLRNLSNGVVNWIYDVFDLGDRFIYSVCPFLRNFSWYIYIKCFK